MSEAIQQATTIPPVKIKWRQHAILLACVVAGVTIAGDIVDLFNLTWQHELRVIAEQNAALTKQPFDLDYLKTVFLPHVATVLLLLSGYLCISLIIVPSARKIAGKKPMYVTVTRILVVLAEVLLLAFLLSLGINIATKFSNPYLYNYDDFQVMALFGYNDKPLSNIFSGFDRATIIVLIFLGFSLIRETITYYVNNLHKRKAYYVLMLNQITAFMVVYFAVYSGMATFRLANDASTFTRFFAFVLPTALVYFTDTYWVFPVKGNAPFFSAATILRLLASIFVCSLPFAFSVVTKISTVLLFDCWAFQLVVTTPVCWLLYQWRKDKIQHLWGIEEQLTTSQANLQFLRSQINPHFLFNALNTLYGTALKEEATVTADGIQKLGDMMRFMLHENTLPFISMEKEIAYLEDYISLQKLRIQSSPDIIIEKHLSRSCQGLSIAPMLLIPFVENAFKHGISLQQKSWINIQLACNNKRIQFIVRNSMHDHKGGDPERNNSGIGLKNVRNRLQLLYANKHELIINQTSSEFIIELTIQQ